MRQVVAGWVVLASLALRPLSAGAHSLLVTPSPRSQTISTTAPCGAGPNVGASVQTYTTGQMVQVSFSEVQSHGTFRLALSSDNTTFGNVLMDNIAAQSNGASHMVTVQMPAIGCDPCVLQLFQRNGGGGYYSCADIRVVAPATTTTTTTSTLPDGSSTTTTTTLADDGCANLDGFDHADCQVARALADPPCAGDTMDPMLDNALRLGLGKVQTLVQTARMKTKPAQVKRLLKRADKKLAAVLKRATRTASLGRTSESCAGSIGTLVAELRATLATLAPKS
jgi:hypothetical protein